MMKDTINLSSLKIGRYTAVSAAQNVNQHTPGKVKVQL